jgi:putative sigma-54 modulation protein
MRIEVKGRNVVVSEELRERIEKRLDKIARQVSPLAQCDVELCEERNPSIADSQIVELTLHLKGVTLRSRDAAPNMTHALNLAADEMARQVKRHREKRRGRRVQTDKVAPRPAAP